MTHIINNDFKNILQPLTDCGWQFIKENEYEIQMNKKYSELEDICVKKSYSSNVIHITIPLQNSAYSFYKRHIGFLVFFSLFHVFYLLSLMFDIL